MTYFKEFGIDPLGGANSPFSMDWPLYRHPLVKPGSAYVYTDPNLPEGRNKVIFISSLVTRNEPPQKWWKRAWRHLTKRG